MRRAAGFTLLEMVIAISILLLIIGLAVPSLNGVIADKRLRRSLDDFNDLVHQAQERSVAEHRAYLLVWARTAEVVLRPETFTKDEPVKPAAQFVMTQGETVMLRLPSALSKKSAGRMDFLAIGNMRTGDR